MKYNKKELNVDFIGGQEPLTEQEEKAISEYLQSSKAKSKNISAKRKARKRPTVSRFREKV